MRVFAREYRPEVAGIVFVDTAHPVDSAHPHQKNKSRSTAVSGSAGTAPLRAGSGVRAPSPLSDQSAR